jgi:hypothetical protein
MAQLGFIVNVLIGTVAETMRAPLYTMSAGDLGLVPEDIETKLSEILEMATRWKAVLLLDEADVFLEQRTLQDLERNKLVSSASLPRSCCPFSLFLLSH